MSEVEDYKSARAGSVTYLLVVVTLGLIANSLVITVFWKYRKLRTATNLFIFNLAVCDITLSVLDCVFSIPSSLHDRWLFGSAGCSAYGFLHYFFICNTVVTLGVISVDRFFFITRPNRVHSIQPNARWMLVAVYVYTLLFTFPPVVGWNSFAEEKFFYSGCYINYVDQRPASIAYSVIASVCLFLVPLAVMIYCYTRIFLAVRNSTQRTISRAGPSQDGGSSVKKKFPILKRTHVQTAKMIIVNIFFFMIVWFPYVVVSLIKASSGEELIVPLASHITILVAKSCVIYNVLIYVILNRKLKAAFIDLVCCGKPPGSLFNNQGQANNARMRISRILNSETEVPTNVAEAQRNRLSALTLANDSISQDVPRSPPRVRNGIVKSVEFEDELTPTLNGRAGGASAREIRISQEDNSTRRKRAPKASRAANGGLSSNNVSGYEETPRKAPRTETPARSRAGTCAPPRQPPAEVGRSAQRQYRESTSSTEGLFPSPSHQVSPRDVMQPYDADAGYRLPSRGDRDSYSGGNNPGDSGCPTSTDQESDLSSVRARSREGSLVRRTVSSAVHRQGGRTRSRGGRGAEGAAFSGARYSSRRRRRRGGNIPLHTSPQELLEIQNYWKRMSLCLDDIDLDDVTREIAIV